MPLVSYDRTTYQNTRMTGPFKCELTKDQTTHLFIKNHCNNRLSSYKSNNVPLPFTSLMALMESMAVAHLRYFQEAGTAHLIKKALEI